MITVILNSMEGPLQLMLAKADANKDLMLIDQNIWEPGGQGAETLIPNLSALLKKNSLTANDINRIACVRGPGSFTGIRLALSTAVGLSISIPASPEMAGLDYLPILAHTAVEDINQNELPGTLWIITHARRGQVNIQGFAVNEQKALSALFPPQNCLLEAALKLIQEKTKGTMFISGSGVSRNAERLNQDLQEARIINDKFYIPSTASLLAAANSAIYSKNAIEPLYLRDSDAEENLPYIAAGLGLDPHQAMLDLLRLTGKVN